MPYASNPNVATGAVLSRYGLSEANLPKVLLFQPSGDCVPYVGPANFQRLSLFIKEHYVTASGASRGRPGSAGITVGDMFGQSVQSNSMSGSGARGVSVTDTSGSIGVSSLFGVSGASVPSAGESAIGTSKGAAVDTPGSIGVGALFGSMPPAGLAPGGGGQGGALFQTPASPWATPRAGSPGASGPSTSSLPGAPHGMNAGQGSGASYEKIHAPDASFPTPLAGGVSSGGGGTASMGVSTGGASVPSGAGVGLDVPSATQAQLASPLFGSVGSAGFSQTGGGVGGVGGITAAASAAVASGPALPSGDGGASAGSASANIFEGKASPVAATWSHATNANTGLDPASPVAVGGFGCGEQASGEQGRASAAEVSLISHNAAAGISAVATSCPPQNSLPDALTAQATPPFSVQRTEKVGTDRVEEDGEESRLRKRVALRPNHLPSVLSLAHFVAARGRDADESRVPVARDALLAEARSLFEQALPLVCVSVCLCVCVSVSVSVSVCLSVCLCLFLVSGGMVRERGGGEEGV